MQALWHEQLYAWLQAARSPGSWQNQGLMKWLGRTEGRARKYLVC